MSLASVVGWDFSLSIGNWLDHWIVAVCYCCNLMWVTVVPPSKKCRCKETTVFHKMLNKLEVGSAVDLSGSKKGKTCAALLRHRLPWPGASRVISNISQTPRMYIPTRTDPTTASHLRPFQSKHNVSVAGAVLNEMENMANVSTTHLYSPQLKKDTCGTRCTLFSENGCLLQGAEKQTECYIR